MDIKDKLEKLGLKSNISDTEKILTTLKREIDENKKNTLDSIMNTSSTPLSSKKSSEKNSPSKSSYKSHKSSPILNAMNHKIFNPQFLNDIQKISENISQSHNNSRRNSPKNVIERSGREQINDSCIINITPVIQDNQIKELPVIPEQPLEQEHWECWPKDCIIYFSQLFIVFILIIFSIVNLTLNPNVNSNIWSSLLGACIGYLIPQPSLPSSLSNNKNTSKTPHSSTPFPNENEKNISL